MPADVVDYQIFGEEMQFVEIELDPGESAIAEVMRAMAVRRDRLGSVRTAGPPKGQRGS